MQLKIGAPSIRGRSYIRHQYFGIFTPPPPYVIKRNYGSTPPLSDM